MSKFSKNKKSKELPAISTASLPDIVFMLLFFFMVATVMREDEMLIENRLPVANQLEQLEDRSKLAYIYIGKPTSAYQGQYGQSDVIQLGDKIAPAAEVYNFINAKRAEMPEQLQNQMMVSLKVDRNAKIGPLNDVKEQLRKANALKINYTAGQGNPMLNISQ